MFLKRKFFPFFFEEIFSSLPFLFLVFLVFMLLYLVPSFFVIFACQCSHASFPISVFYWYPYSLKLFSFFWKSALFVFCDFFFSSIWGWILIYQFCFTQEKIDFTQPLFYAQNYFSCFTFFLQVLSFFHFFVSLFVHFYFLSFLFLYLIFLFAIFLLFNLFLIQKNILFLSKNIFYFLFAKIFYSKIFFSF